MTVYGHKKVRDTIPAVVANVVISMSLGIYLSFAWNKIDLSQKKKKNLNKSKGSLSHSP